MRALTLGALIACMMAGCATTGATARKDPQVRSMQLARTENARCFKNVQFAYRPGFDDAAFVKFVFDPKQKDCFLDSLGIKDKLVGGNSKFFFLAGSEQAWWKPNQLDDYFSYDASERKVSRKYIVGQEGEDLVCYVEAFEM